MIFASFVSCGGGNDDVMSRASKKLDKVKVTENTVQTVDDVVLMFDGMSADEQTQMTEQLKMQFDKTGNDVTYYDGDNSYRTDSDGFDMIVYKNVAYYDYSLLKYKVKLPKSKIEDAATAISNDFGFKAGLETFESYDIINNSDGSMTINASGNKNDEALNNIFASSTVNVEYEILNAEYVIEIDSQGRYSSICSDVTVKMTMAYGTNGYIITMTTKDNKSFDYDDVMTVKVPADADEYEEMDFSDILQM